MQTEREGKRARQFEVFRIRPARLREGWRGGWCRHGPAPYGLHCRFSSPPLPVHASEGSGDKNDGRRSEILRAGS